MRIVLPAVNEPPATPMRAFFPMILTSTKIGSPLGNSCLSVSCWGCPLTSSVAKLGVTSVVIVPPEPLAPGAPPGTVGVAGFDEPDDAPDEPADDVATFTCGTNGS